MRSSGRTSADEVPSVVGMALSKGTKVSWHTSQGTTHGHVVEKKTSDFTLDGRHWKASASDPKFVVESEKTGAHAAHEESALTEV